MIERNTMLNAEKGDKVCQFELCKYYYEERFYNFAFFWAKKSAEQGYGPAMVTLGEFYRLGIGTKIDINLAHKWFKKATSKKENKAITWLIGEYISGIFKTSKRCIFNLSKRVCKKDKTVGEYYLGLCYYKGIGVRKNVKKARKHFEKSANSGCVFAQMQLNDKTLKTV